MCWKGSNTSFVKKKTCGGIWCVCGLKKKCGEKDRDVLMCKKNGCGRKNITIIMGKKII